MMEWASEGEDWHEHEEVEPAVLCPGEGTEGDENFWRFSSEAVDCQAWINRSVGLISGRWWEVLYHYKLLVLLLLL